MPRATDKTLRTVADLERELKAAHKRTELCNLRLAHIEHYLGLRQHDFDPRESRWAFRQVHIDVSKNQRPVEVRSLYHINKNL